MDTFLDNSNAINRLLNEWQTHGKIIIAYDFDDTVYDYHQKGRTYTNVIQLLQRWQKVGAYFIVFTCCDEEKHDSITKYLNENHIPFDKINDNLDFVSFTGRKVYYNILLDDRAGLSASYHILLKTVETIEKYYNTKEN